MVSRALLGMRWGDLTDDMRQRLLEQADLDNFDGSEDMQHGSGILHFSNTMLAIRASRGRGRFFNRLSHGFYIDDDAVFVRA